jgi:hypothetical protein
MQKIKSLIASALLLSLLAISSIAADPPALPRTTTVSILFKGGNASLQYYIESGTLTNIEKDLLGRLDPEFRQYTFFSNKRNSTVTINLREVASVTIDK